MAEVRMPSHLQMSTPKMTVCVKVSAGKVVDAAPIIRKFIGQHVDHLILWLSRVGGQKNGFVEVFDLRNSDGNYHVDHDYIGR